MDNAGLCISDPGSNCFVTQGDAGKKRANVVCEWLLEMDLDVSIKAVVHFFKINKYLHFFKIDIVLATQLYGEDNRKPAAFCHVIVICSCLSTTWCALSSPRCCARATT